MIKSFLIITLAVIFTATLSGQTVVKMAMPEQTDEALSVTTLFEEKIPLEVSTYLGPMGYDVNGGLAPYTWQWLENENILSTNNIALITPAAGNSYSVVVVDKNNCSVILPIEISGEGLKNAGPQAEVIVLSSSSGQYLKVELNGETSGNITLRMFDVKGAKHFETLISADTEIPLNVPAGVYFLYVEGTNLQYVEKFIIP